MKTKPSTFDEKASVTRLNSFGRRVVQIRMSLSREVIQMNNNSLKNPDKDHSSYFPNKPENLAGSYKNAAIVLKAI